MTKYQMRQAHRLTGLTKQSQEVIVIAIDEKTRNHSKKQGEDAENRTE